MLPVTLYLTVSVSLNTTSHPGKRDLVGAGGAITPTIAQDSTRSTVAGSMPLAAGGSAGMSPAKNALRNADEAMMTINLSNTWEGALERIKWVMDTVSPVAEVRAMSFLPILD